MDSTQQSSSVLSSIVQDPHVQALLHKETSTERAASREEAKLEQLVVDSNSPLYDGCNPEVTRLSFTLQLLKTILYILGAAEERQVHGRIPD